MAGNGDVARFEDEVPRPAWERQRGEGDRPFRYFAVYRDLGYTRSYVRVAEAFGLSHTRIQQLGQKWSWRERAEAWDMELDRQGREETMRRRNEINHRHRQLGQSLYRMGALRLRGDDERGIAALDPNLFDPMETLRFVVEGAKLERLASGEATEAIRNAMAVPLMTLRDLIHEIVGLALERIDDDLQPGFLREVESTVRGRLE